MTNHDTNLSNEQLIIINKIENYAQQLIEKEESYWQDEVYSQDPNGRYYYNEEIVNNNLEKLEENLGDQMYFFQNRLLDSNKFLELEQDEQIHQSNSAKDLDIAFVCNIITAIRNKVSTPDQIRERYTQIMLSKNTDGTFFDPFSNDFDLKIQRLKELHSVGLSYSNILNELELEFGDTNLSKESLANYIYRNRSELNLPKRNVRNLLTNPHNFFEGDMEGYKSFFKTVIELRKPIDGVLLTNSQIVEKLITIYQIPLSVGQFNVWLKNAKTPEGQFVALTDESRLAQIASQVNTIYDFNIDPSNILYELDNFLATGASNIDVMKFLRERGIEYNKSNIANIKRRLLESEMLPNYQSYLEKKEINLSLVKNELSRITILDDYIKINSGKLVLNIESIPNFMNLLELMINHTPTEIERTLGNWIRSQGIENLNPPSRSTIKSWKEQLLKN